MKWFEAHPPKGKTCVDVGCWEGDNCVVALKRGASEAVGVDLCTSPHLAANLKTHPFSFIQMDVLSEKWVQLKPFDVVTCFGVLYHVENPFSLIARLVSKAKERVFIGTAMYAGGGDEPLMRLYPGSTLMGNPSNWWMPNAACMRQMLAAAGCTDIEIIEEHKSSRAVFMATPHSGVAYDKLIPRWEHLMPVAEQAGNRRRQKVST
jgi:hypothetical protein